MSDLDNLVDVKNWSINTDPEAYDIYEWQVKKNPPPIKEAAAELARLRADNATLQTAVDEAREWEKFHPRAVKNLRKRCNFLVVKQDEPYFDVVYGLIRKTETDKGTWTDDDEVAYQSATNPDFMPNAFNAHDKDER